MARTIAGRNITHVKIVDDDPAARQGTALTVVDAEFVALQDEGPLPELPEFVEQTMAAADAVVCDHRMVGNYSRFNGAEASADLYKAGCPAVLCTRWSTADIDAMRKYVRYIPALISSDNLTPDALADGFDRCIRELNKEPVPTRQAWRTLLRVESVARDLKPALFYVGISGWDSKEIVRLPLDLIPAQYQKEIESGFRFYAQVNKGAEREEALFFFDFEFPVRK